MNTKIGWLTLFVVVGAASAAFSAQESADDSFARRLNQAEFERIGESGTVPGRAVAVPVARSTTHTYLHDYNSNVRDLYRIVENAARAQGQAPVCRDESIEMHGRKPACSVTARVNPVYVSVNNLIYWYAYTVDVQGPVHCWQYWHEDVHSPRPSSYSLWDECEFDEINGTRRQ